MIPKILHQCSKSYVWEERQLARRARELMPDFDYRAWTDESNLQLVQDHAPQFLADYLSIPVGVIRVDIARCLYMYVYGGIYFDTDYVFYKPLDETFLAHQCVLAIEEEECESIGGNPKLGNAFMASEPGFAMWLKFIEEIFAKHRAGETNIVFLSGPHALTLFLQAHPEYHQQITIMPGHIIYPEFAMAKLTAKKTAHTIGAHLCWGSWRGKPLLQYLRSRLRRWISAVV
jgi:mannosyltransferase OCH1-like enzyme